MLGFGKLSISVTLYLSKGLSHVLTLAKVQWRQNPPQGGVEFPQNGTWASGTVHLSAFFGITPRYRLKIGGSSSRRNAVVFSEP